MSLVYNEYRGVSNLYYAVMSTDDNETGTGHGLTYDTPKQLAGIGELSKSTASSSATHYYDNGPRIIIDSTGADTLTLKVDAIEQDVLADLLGRHYDSAKKVMVESNDHDVAPYVAIGYMTEKTDGTKVLVWRYKCKVGIPEENAKTRDDGTDAEGQTLAITCIETTHKFNFGTQQAQDMHTAKAVYCENASKEATWFSAVQTIETALA